MKVIWPNAFDWLCNKSSSRNKICHSFPRCLLILAIRRPCESIHLSSLNVFVHYNPNTLTPVHNIVWSIFWFNWFFNYLFRRIPLLFDQRGNDTSVMNDHVLVGMIPTGKNNYYFCKLMYCILLYQAQLSSEYLIILNWTICKGERIRVMKMSSSPLTISISTYYQELMSATKECQTPLYFANHLLSNHTCADCLIW